MESLLALATFAAISTLIVGAMDSSRSQVRRIQEQKAILSVAKIAVQTNQSSLELDGILVQVERKTDSLTVYHQGVEVLHVEKE